MLAVTTAETALWVSIASASVSVTSLVWQLMLYRLSGARLIVRLVPAVVTESGHIIRGPAKGWQASMPEGMNVVQDRPWVDAAVIEVVNVGRAPISLSTINLDVGAEPRLRPWRRHTVGMPPIAIHGGLADLDDVRLDAGRKVYAVLDYWPAVESARKFRRRVHIRASVVPAGRRAKRSPWHQRWTILPTQQQLWPHGPEGHQVQLFQAVWRTIAPIAPDAVYKAWLSILKLLMPEDVDPKMIGIHELSDALEPIFDDPMQALWPSVHIQAAVREHGEAGAWMPPHRKSKPDSG